MEITSHPSKMVAIFRGVVQFEGLFNFSIGLNEGSQDIVTPINIRKN